MRFLHQSLLRYCNHFFFGNVIIFPYPFIFPPSVRVINDVLIAPKEKKNIQVKTIITEIFFTNNIKGVISKPRIRKKGLLYWYHKIIPRIYEIKTSENIFKDIFLPSSFRWLNMFTELFKKFFCLTWQFFWSLYRY